MGVTDRGARARAAAPSIADDEGSPVRRRATVRTGRARAVTGAADETDAGAATGVWRPAAPAGTTASAAWASSPAGGSVGPGPLLGPSVGTPSGVRWTAAVEGGADRGAPRPARRETAASGTAVSAAQWVAAGAPEPGGIWAAGPFGAALIGAPRPTGRVAEPDGDAGASDQRLTVRAGAEPCSGGIERPAAGGDPAVPGDAVAATRSGNDAAEGAPAAGVPGGRAVRWATATGAPLVVRGRTGGVTVAEGATDGRCLTGSSSWAGEGTGSRKASATPAADAPIAAIGARWAGLVGMGACEVRLGTVETRATTMPAGASTPVSWPSVPTIGGSGRCPGTASRNGPAGATTGGGAMVRWIAGSVAQAPVGGPGRSPADGTIAGSLAAGPSGVTGEGPSDGVLRPNGQGRRTGLTPPRTGAC